MGGDPSVHTHRTLSGHTTHTLSALFLRLEREKPQEKARARAKFSRCRSAKNPLFSACIFMLYTYIRDGRECALAGTKCAVAVFYGDMSKCMCVRRCVG